MTRPLQEVCETRLDNDVLVVTCPHHGGAAAVYVGFRVGSIDERDDEH
jgi:predicted Zn-dependent peptidase